MADSPTDVLKRVFTADQLAEIANIAEGGEAEPEFMSIADGEIVFFDYAAFVAEHKIIAMSHDGGELFVLRPSATGFEWVNVEKIKDAPAPAPAGRLRSIK